MKTRTILKGLTVAAAILCAATFQVAAQPGGGGGGGGGFGGGGGRGFGGRGFGILTQEQRQTMNDAVQNDSTLTDLETKLAAAQKDAVNAALAKDATEDSVKAKVQAVADLETQIAMERYKKGVKPIVSGITDDQKSQLDNMPNGRGYTMAYGELFGGGRGGFGGFGGRRGGFGGGGGGFGGGGGGGN
ncbi:MAG TPA: periplasmic heavy metal sensor [Verrucomicrobiae bacterium]|nr:periplasmic heavy metal sensor [Verrucomicrobiae bacterium]